MKLTKLSLVAALAVSTAFAGGDIAPVEPAPMVETSPWTIGGDAKLFYDTMRRSDVPNISLFDQASARGQGAASVDVSYAFADTWKVNAGVTGLFTLGLDDSVVSNVWLYAGADATNGAGTPLAIGMDPFTSIGDALWIDTLNVTGTMMDGALTVVLGRQELDTPFAFSEQWTIAANTFDAAVAIVKPMEAVTLVGAYIHDGNGNGQRISTFDSNPGGFTGDNGYLPGIADKGAWTVAAIGTFSGITAQAWYYDVLDVAQAVWLQADADFAGFQIGAQYAWMGVDDVLSTTLNDSKGYAGKIGYKMDAFNVWGAYSSVEDDGYLALGNTATMLPNAGWGGGNGSGQSKLYTEAWWNYGLVSQAGADSFAVAATYDFGDVSVINGLSLMGQYTDISIDTLTPGIGAFSAFDVNEFTALVGGTAYGLNVQLAYIWADYSYPTNPLADYNSDTIQAYLTYQF